MPSFAASGKMTPMGVPNVLDPTKTGIIDKVLEQPVDRFGRPLYTTDEMTGLGAVNKGAVVSGDMGGFTSSPDEWYLGDKRLYDTTPSDQTAYGMDDAPRTPIASTGTYALGAKPAMQSKYTSDQRDTFLQDLRDTIYSPAPSGGYKTVPLGQLVDMYNKMDPALESIDPKELYLLTRGSDYWKEGSKRLFLPGESIVTEANLRAGMKQWQQDDKASLIDTVGPIIIMGAVTMGFGAALAPVLAGAATAAGAGAVTAGYVGAVGGGAVASGLVANAQGGDVEKAMIVGGIGGGFGQFASGMEGGANFVGPVQNSTLNMANIANAGGKAAIAAATGGNPLAAGAQSLVGSAVGNETGSPAAGVIANAATGILLNQDQQQTINALPTATVPVATETTPTGFASLLPSTFKFIDLSERRSK